MRKQKTILAISGLLTVVIIIVLIFLIGNFNTKGRVTPSIPKNGNAPITSLTAPGECRECHQASSSESGQYFKWQGSLMSQSARDPLVNAATELAIKDNREAGNLCLRCHAPIGWLQSRSADTSLLTSDDLEGITCDFCHRMAEPGSQNIGSAGDNQTGGLSDGRYVLSTEADVKIGPRDGEIAPHKTKGDTFYTGSAFCGTCHDGTNPLTNMPMYRTYSEWKYSWYATQGENGTCQACHMKPVAGFAAEPRLTANEVPYRDNIAGHDFTGAANWILDALPLIWSDLDPVPLRAGKERSLQTLSQAAKIDLRLSRKSGAMILDARVYNLTGHKLPTGFAPGRRIWLAVNGFDSANKPVFKSGYYDKEALKLEKDPQLKVYEAISGEDNKKQSFHLLKNSEIIMDNRIPPKGFSASKFKQAGAQPVGALYASGQNWDDTAYRMPLNVSSVTVTLYYQSTSKEFIDALGEANEWGTRLKDAWEQTGSGAPVEMISATAKAN